jgi:surfactin synthase thioesterase subunit
VTGVAFFPGAGSFGAEFQSLVDTLGPAPRLVRYPGRYGRDSGIAAASFDAVVCACVDQLAGQRPAVLFGHSFGAYVAYATALRLQDTGSPVALLVVAGAAAPGRLAVPRLATGSPAAAAAYLDSVDPGALADAPSAEWREIVVETALQDLRLLRQFDDRGRVGGPILAVRGDEDPLTSDADLAGWSEATDGTLTRRTFPGGHSDFLRTPACTSWLRTIVAPHT